MRSRQAEEERARERKLGLALLTWTEPYLFFSTFGRADRADGAALVDANDDDDDAVAAGLVNKCWTIERAG